MVSHCLYSLLTGVPTPGGTWTYLTPGNGNVDVATCPVVGVNCTGALMSKAPGTIIASGAGSENTCVTFTNIGVYQFEYTVTGTCCSPCSSIVTVTIGALDLSLTALVSTCTDTIELIGGSISPNCCSTSANGSATVRVNNTCYPGGPSVVSTATIPVNAYIGWELPLVNKFLECGDVYSVDLTIATCEAGTIKHVTKTVTGLNDGFLSCPGQFKYTGSNINLVADWYLCALETKIQAFFSSDVPGGIVTNGVHYSLTVTGLGNILKIKFGIKNMDSAGCCISNPSCLWIGPNISAPCVWNPEDLCADMYKSTSFAYVDSKATITLPFTSLPGLCASPATYNLQITFGNILNPVLCNFDKLAFSTYSNWTILNVVSTPPGKFMFNGMYWQNTCKSILLTASTTCLGSKQFMWSNGSFDTDVSSSSRVFFADSGGTTQCRSVRLTCGGCSVCKHICFSESLGLIGTVNTGDCSSGCGVDGVTCSNPPNQF